MRVVVLAALITLGLAGCATRQQTVSTAVGTGVGAAVAGPVGAVAGAGVGAVAGAPGGVVDEVQGDNRRRARRR